MREFCSQAIAVPTDVTDETAVQALANRAIRSKHFAMLGGNFRVKRIVLGRTFESFLERHLASDGEIFLVDCTLKWPTTEVRERHFSLGRD